MFEVCLVGYYMYKVHILYAKNTMATDFVKTDISAGTKAKTKNLDKFIHHQWQKFDKYESDFYKEDHSDTSYIVVHSLTVTQQRNELYKNLIIWCSVSQPIRTTEIYSSEWFRTV